MSSIAQHTRSRSPEITTIPRYKIRFRDPAALRAAQAVEAPMSQVQVVNQKRQFLGVRLPPAARDSVGAFRAFETQLRSYEEIFGGEIVEDFQYSMEAEIFDPESFRPERPQDPSLDDVLSMIRAREAWELSRGDGVTIAVVDTGIDGRRPEFPLSKRMGSWQPVGVQPWTDYNGHGTMCACIAAGTRAEGGAFDGVAPDASVIACRTGFFDTELTTIYDYLIGLVQTKGLTIVATNSFGIRSGEPPPDPANSDFDAALDDAIAAGIHVRFSAGNYHDLAGGDPALCSPTSIWLHKSRADVMAVATCKLDKSMWYYSSRGPGQRFGAPDTNQKPDVTAPTPENGRIVFGNDIVTLPEGWGTSGACPQTAGLSALLLGQKKSLSGQEVIKTIRGTSTALGHGVDCEGAGLIDCLAAVRSV
ncbi:MAG TPA: S8 family serine peptidase [Thermoanaerobaculia bacterium]|nr:S8 family serine peptidase [Thermoanaerobaculia bacterium]